MTKQEELEQAIVLGLAARKMYNYVSYASDDPCDELSMYIFDLSSHWLNRAYELLYNS